MAFDLALRDNGAGSFDLALTNTSGSTAFPSAGSLALAGNAPTVKQSLFSTPSPAGLSLAGVAPTVTVGAPSSNTNANPTVGAVVITGAAGAVVYGNIIQVPTGG
jgi:hypothetical protein